MSGHISASPGFDEGAAALRALTDGRLTIEGRLVTASNATMYCRVDFQSTTAHCVYKPVAGERPLWDFPDGTLAKREMAAYVLSEATGWRLIPPTLLRDGPLGPGMCQLWVDVDAAADDLVDIFSPGEVPAGWRTVLSAHDQADRPVVLAHADDPRLRRLALLDVVVNNADRKGGHLLVTADRGLQAVDHGVCFHEDFKLRTVLWGWAGESITAGERADLEGVRRRLAGELGGRLAEFLSRAELDATRDRLDRILRTGRFPRPGAHWPAIPWPAF